MHPEARKRGFVAHSRGCACKLHYNGGMDTQRQIPFSPPDITQAEIDEVVDTLESGWITTGPKELFPIGHIDIERP